MKKIMQSLLRISLVALFFCSYQQNTRAEDIIPIVTMPTETAPVTESIPVTEKKAKKEKKPKAEKTTVAGTATFLGSKAMGLDVIGFAEFSQLNKLYNLSGVNVGSISTMGYGFTLNGDFGLKDRLRLGVDLGYSRLTYSNKFKTTVGRNYFLTDVMLHYLLSKNSEKILPYLAGGAGLELSGSGLIPLLDLGIGADIPLSPKVSLSAKLIYKTAFVHHRIEPAFGVRFRF